MNTFSMRILFFLGAMQQFFFPPNIPLQSSVSEKIVVSLPPTQKKTQHTVSFLGSSCVQKKNRVAVK